MAHIVANRPKDEAWRRDEGCLPPASDWVDTMVLELGLPGHRRRQSIRHRGRRNSGAFAGRCGRHDIGGSPHRRGISAEGTGGRGRNCRTIWVRWVAVLKDICAHFDAEPVDTRAFNGQQTIALTQALGLRREFIRLSGVIDRIGECAMSVPPAAETGAMLQTGPEPDLAAAIPGEI